MRIKLKQKIFWRPTESAIQPRIKLPRNRPIKAELPIMPCQNGDRFICGVICVSAKPTDPRM